MCDNRKASVILPAGGKGTRMGESINKQYLLLKDIPILAWTWRVFARLPCVSEIFLVVASGEEPYCREQVVNPHLEEGMCQDIFVISGGRERRDSVYEGLKRVSDHSDLVIIHDGARPLISDDVIARTMDLADKHGAAIAGVPVKDTIKTVRTINNDISSASVGSNISKSDNIPEVDCLAVDKTLPRENLIQVQTPQIFQRKLILKAYNRAYKKNISATDDSMLVEDLGEQVAYAQGEYHNIKITTPDDIWAAEEYIRQRGRDL